MTNERSEQTEIPAAFQNNPILAVLRSSETFKEIARQVQYCEISWPQSYVMGEPIRLKTAKDPSDDQ